MRLLLTPTEVDTSTTFKSQNFVIGDISIILEILRSKIYSNPIHIVCQEIMSNARDAHREVGTPEVPIHVTFPDEFDDTLQIRDFGPGITPDRMANVFIQYGKSTKRDDNIQTGGFGLGAKTPFSYGDSFAIVSITSETGTKMRRQYVAYIDQSRCGTMSLVSEAPTDEPHGTTIVITPKPGDVHLFQQAAQKVCEYWTIRPKFFPEESVTYQERKVLYEGTDWQIFDDAKAPQVIIDGIPYPLDTYILNPGIEYEGLLKKHLIMQFKIGELKITASREAIDYQPDVKGIIKARLKQVLNELRVKTSAYLATAKNLWEASVLWNDFNEHFSLDIGEWNGLKVRPTLDIFQEYAKVFKVSKDSDAVDCLRVKALQYYKTEIIFAKDHLLAEDDTGNKRPSRSRLATLFERNPGIRTIYVVTPHNSTSRTRDDNKAKLDDKCNYLKYEATLLSTIPYRVIPRDPNAPRQASVQAKVRLLNGSQEWEPCEDDVMDDPDGGVYVVKKGGQITCPPLNVDKKKLIEYSAMLDQEIYYVIERYVGDLGPAWKPLHKALTDAADELEKDPDVASCSSPDEASQSFSNHHRGLWDIINQPKVLAELSPDGVCMRYVKASLKFSDTAKKISRLQDLRRILGQPQKSDGKAMQLLADEFDRKYPLILGMDQWRIHYNVHKTDFVADVIAYFNGKDGMNVIHQPHQNP
jgi:hypothetical protein